MIGQMRLLANSRNLREETWRNFWVNYERVLVFKVFDVVWETGAIELMDHDELFRRIILNKKLKIALYEYYWNIINIMLDKY